MRWKIGQTGRGANPNFSAMDHQNGGLGEEFWIEVWEGIQQKLWGKTCPFCFLK